MVGKKPIYDSFGDAEREWGEKTRTSRAAGTFAMERMANSPRFAEQQHSDQRTTPESKGAAQKRQETEVILRPVPKSSFRLLKATPKPGAQPKPN